MEFVDYIQLCKRTWRFQNQEKDTRHCLNGIGSEIGELQSCIKKEVGYGKDVDLVNLLEECGDAIYFNLRLYDILFPKNSRDLFNDFLVSNNTNKDLSGVERNTFLIQSNTQKIYESIIFNKDFSYYNLNRCFDLIVENVRYISEILHFGKFDFEQCLSANIEKLAKRFPEKFDDYLAFNRNLDIERKSLEDNAKI